MNAMFAALYAFSITFAVSEAVVDESLVNG
jgi:hypothetical protein